MAGLVPAIHVFLFVVFKTWMFGTRLGMTRINSALIDAGYSNPSPSTPCAI